MIDERREETGKEPVWIEKAVALYRQIKDSRREE
jgi:hypothetical protein